jgi:hypothetical protein
MPALTCRDASSSTNASNSRNASNLWKDYKCCMRRQKCSKSTEVSTEHEGDSYSKVAAKTAGAQASRNTSNSGDAT